MVSCSVDFVVTDPPYGLKFMGKKWDYQIPSVEIWHELLRVCKPGAMILCFGGTRTFHRLTCNIEDAGWEIRDCMMWLYGSGFPKSHNNFGLEGYGTALKPAWEPIIMAMKPLTGTYEENFKKWKIGGINIDDSRIGTGGTKRSHQSDYPKNEDGTEDRSEHWARTGHSIEAIDKGRWPANLILDEEAGTMLDEQSGISFSPKEIVKGAGRSGGIKGKTTGHHFQQGHGDSGGASRFFYCAKVSPSERGKHNNHPTIKPQKLLEYLIKLLAPSGNPILLDPFCGSGSTLVACKTLGVQGIGIDICEEYCEIAKKRIEFIPESDDK